MLSDDSGVNALPINSKNFFIPFIPDSAQPDTTFRASAIPSIAEANTFALSAFFCGSFKASKNLLKRSTALEPIAFEISTIVFPRFLRDSVKLLNSGVSLKLDQISTNLVQSEIHIPKLFADVFILSKRLKSLNNLLKPLFLSELVSCIYDASFGFITLLFISSIFSSKFSIPSVSGSILFFVKKPFISPQKPVTFSFKLDILPIN